MSRAIFIDKRSLNVALIITILWSIFLVIVFTNVSCLNHWISEGFITCGIIPRVLGYGAVLAMNYIFFWRSNPVAQNEN